MFETILQKTHPPFFLHPATIPPAHHNPLIP
jgi:hypothetical protein